MTSTSRARTANLSSLPVPPSLPIDSDRWGVPIQLVERRVLHPGHWRWLRAVAWLGLVFFRTAGAFGIPLQAAVDLLPPGNAALDFAGLLVACASALGYYALAVQVGEGRGASELALRPALSGLAVGAVIGLWRAFGPVPAFAVSALVFAALHLANPGALDRRQHRPPGCRSLADRRNPSARRPRCSPYSWSAR